MAPVKGTSSAIIVDEFIFSGATSRAEVQLSLDELDSTNLDSSAMEYIPGLKTMSISQNGYFTGGDANGIADELHDRLGVAGVIVTYLPLKNTNGSPAYVIPNAFNSNLPISADAPSIITMNGQWSASEGGKRGLLIAYNLELDATGNETAIDFGSAGSAGGAAYLHVHSIDDDEDGASTDTILKVQSSSDNTTFADEATFTFSATGGFSAALSGTVNRYVRLSTTDLGGATSLKVTLIVVIDNVTM